MKGSLTMTRSIIRTAAIATVTAATFGLAATVHAGEGGEKTENFAPSAP
jgi:hypothetical protein